MTFSQMTSFIQKLSSIWVRLSKSFFLWYHFSGTGQLLVMHFLFSSSYLLILHVTRCFSNWMLHWGKIRLVGVRIWFFVCGDLVGVQMVSAFYHLFYFVSFAVPFHFLYLPANATYSQFYLYSIVYSILFWKRLNHWYYAVNLLILFYTLILNTFVVLIYYLINWFYFRVMLGIVTIESQLESQFIWQSSSGW